MLAGCGTAARIHALAGQFKREHGFEGTLILPEHLHVTLFHLGDWAALPEEIVKLAKDAASQVKAAPFEVAFPRAESFRNSTGVYPFVLTGDVADWQASHRARRGAAEGRLGRRDQGRVQAAYDARLRQGAREADHDCADLMDRARIRAGP